MSKKAEPYIVIAQQAWEINLGSNARNLALEFSKTRPVLYINPALDINSTLKQIRTPYGRRRLKLGLGLGRNTVQVADNIWVHTPSYVGLSINRLRDTTLYNWCNRMNAKRFFGSLKKTIRNLGWKKEECIVFNDSQMFVGAYTKKYLQPLLNFYYIRDNLVEHPYFKYHGSRIEPLAIKNADAVFANSSYLADYARRHHRISLNIGQGCELEIYDAAKSCDVPEDLASIPHPRIGYIGFLTGERLDIPLLEELAESKKEWNWVFIGPEEIMFQQSKLHRMDNVFFTGTKKPSELPGYTQHLDVCLNPQLVNPLTVGNYPRKIDEYLALGKPVVATQTPAMNMFLPHVHLAVGADAYVDAINHALKAKPTEAVASAIRFAKGHTWKACVEKIYRIQNQLSYEKVFATHKPERC